MNFIFLIILIVICILLSIPVKMVIKCVDSSFDIKIYYIFLKFDLPPKKKNEREKDSQVKKRGIKKNTLKKTSSYVRGLKIIFPVVIFFFKKIKFKKMHLFVKISSDDPKRCAILYSHVYSVSKSILGIFDIKSKVKDLKIRIIPDFVSSETSYFGEIILSISFLDIFITLIYGIYTCVKSINFSRE